jgi:hypothetical protein
MFHAGTRFAVKEERMADPIRSDQPIGEPEREPHETEPVERSEHRTSARDGPPAGDPDEAEKRREQRGAVDDLRDVWDRNRGK